MMRILIAVAVALLPGGLVVLGVWHLYRKYKDEGMPENSAYTAEDEAHNDYEQEHCN